MKVFVLSLLFFYVFIQQLLLASVATSMTEDAIHNEAVHLLGTFFTDFKGVDPTDLVIGFKNEFDVTAFKAELLALKGKLEHIENIPDNYKCNNDGKAGIATIGGKTDAGVIFDKYATLKAEYDSKKVNKVDLAKQNMSSLLSFVNTGEYKTTMDKIDTITDATKRNNLIAAANAVKAKITNEMSDFSLFIKNKGGPTLPALTDFANDADWIKVRTSTEIENNLDLIRQKKVDLESFLNTKHAPAVDRINTISNSIKKSPLLAAANSVSGKINGEIASCNAFITANGVNSSNGVALPLLVITDFANNADWKKVKDGIMIEDNVDLIKQKRADLQSFLSAIGEYGITVAKIETITDANKKNNLLGEAGIVKTKIEQEIGFFDTFINAGGVDGSSAALTLPTITDFANDTAWKKVTTDAAIASQTADPPSGTLPTPNSPNTSQDSDGVKAARVQRGIIINFGIQAKVQQIKDSTPDLNEKAKKALDDLVIAVNSRLANLEQQITNPGTVETDVIEETAVKLQAELDKAKNTSADSGAAKGANNNTEQTVNPNPNDSEGVKFAKEQIKIINKVKVQVEQELKKTPPPKKKAKEALDKLLEDLEKKLEKLNGQINDSNTLKENVVEENEDALLAKFQEAKKAGDSSDNSRGGSGGTPKEPSGSVAVKMSVAFAIAIFGVVLATF